MHVHGHMIFVYGSLLAPQLVGELIGFNPFSIAARVSGFRRVSLKDCGYPSLMMSDISSDEVEGKILFGMTDEALHMLRLYEGDLYTSIEIPARTESLNVINVLAFIARPDVGCCESNWSYDDWFAKGGLEIALEECRSIRDELRLSSTVI